MPRVTMPVIADVRGGGTKYYVDNKELSFSASAAPVPTAEGSLIISDAALLYAELLHPGAAHYHLETDANTADWTPNLTLPDDAYIGLPGPGGRLAFDLTPNPDQLKVTDADLNFVTTAHGIIHVDGVTAGMVLRADGTRYVPSAAASTLPIAPLAVGDTLIATAGPLWDILTTPGAAGYARVSTATTEAWSQTPAWTGTHSFAAGITLNGVSDANELTIPDNLAIAFELEDAGGLEYLRIVSTDAQPVIDFNTGEADVDFRVRASGVTNALSILGSNGHVGILTPPTADHALRVVSAGQTAAISGTETTGVAVGGTSTDGSGGSFASVNDHGVFGQTSSAGATDNGVWGNATDAGRGVYGTADSGVGIQGSSATGIAGRFDLTGAGTAILLCEDAGTDVFTIQDGGQADFAEYLRHLGDTDTFWRFQTDRATLDCGGVTMLDAIEAASDEIHLFPSGSGSVAINDASPLGDLDVGGVAPTSAAALTGANISSLAVGGAVAGRLYAQGSVQADLILDDTGAAVDEKLVQLVCEGGLTKFRVLTDAGGIAVDDILAMLHSNGRVGIGTNAPGSLMEWNMADDDLEFVDAHAATGVGSINAVIEAQIGGVTTYIPGYNSFS